MRWKLLRRRLATPRVTVRRHLPWPIRWLSGALVLGFSAAIALWAFETGKDLAGLDRSAKAELARLRDEQAGLKEERDKAQALANTADSLLKTEKAAEDRLAAQLRQSEADKLALKADLGFFQQLIPQGGGTPEGLAVRGFQVEVAAPGHVRPAPPGAGNGRVQVRPPRPGSRAPPGLRACRRPAGSVAGRSRDRP